MKNGEGWADEDGNKTDEELRKAGRMTRRLKMVEKKVVGNDG